MTKQDIDKILSVVHGDKQKRLVKGILVKYTGIIPQEYEEIKILKKDGKLWMKK